MYIYLRVQDSRLELYVVVELRSFVVSLFLFCDGTVFCCGYVNQVLWPNFAVK